MRFSRFNNPRKKHRRKKLSRSDADIIASKQMLDDRRLGIEHGLAYYDALSDRLCGKPSRNIFNDTTNVKGE